MSRSFNCELAGGICLALFVAQSAHAQATSGELEEIVVTAARQGGQSLQEVPLAIQAFSGDELERRMVREMADLVTAIPGATEGEQVGSIIRTFTLRGVGAAGENGDVVCGSLAPLGGSHAFAGLLSALFVPREDSRSCLSLF